MFSVTSLMIVAFVALQSAIVHSGVSRQSQYDYIVVGSGAAGSMVASEMATLFPNDEILLIEEGSFSRVNGQIDNLALKSEVQVDPTIDRGYFSTPQTGLNDRELSLFRAKITGGCNSHNSNAYILADEMDFDRWGNIPGWSLDDILDVWDEIKQVNPGDKLDETNEFLQRLLNAAQENGYPYNSDFFDLRDGTQMGSTPLVLQGSILNDSYIRRRSSWTDFIEPLLPSDKLEIVILTRVNKILFEETSSSLSSSSSSSSSSSTKKAKPKAIGIEAENLGTFEIMNYYARKEIIISCGVYDTPKLLMLSGIGDCDNLENNFNINCVKHSPGVGQNLQDHLGVFLRWQFVSFNDENDENGDLDDLEPVIDELPELVKNGAIYAAGGIVTVSNESRCINYVGPILSGEDIFIASGVFAQQLESVGGVNLFDSDPNSRPVIDHEYLNDENGNDIESVLDCIKLGRELIEGTTAFDDYFNDYNIGIVEIVPGSDISDIDSDDEIKEWIRNNAFTGTHPTSSSKMGKEYDYYNNGDTSIVVNEQLQVIGVDNLRIGDASIMPKTVSANTNLMSMIIGKKTAKFIAQDRYRQKN